jgi:hypothetical protein
LELVAFIHFQASPLEVSILRGSKAVAVVAVGLVHERRMKKETLRRMRTGNKDRLRWLQSSIVIVVDDGSICNP